MFALRIGILALAFHFVSCQFIPLPLFSNAEPPRFIAIFVFPPVTLQAKKGGGMRASIPDECGTESFEFQSRKKPGDEWKGSNVTSKTGGNWIFEDPYAALVPGETIFYRCSIQRRGSILDKPDAEWVVPEFADDFSPLDPPKKPEDCPEDPTTTTTEKPKTTKKPDEKKEETTMNPEKRSSTTPKPENENSKDPEEEKNPKKDKTKPEKDDKKPEEDDKKPEKDDKNPENKNDNDEDKKEKDPENNEEDSEKQPEKTTKKPDEDKENPDKDKKSSENPPKKPDEDAEDPKNKPDEDKPPKDDDKPPQPKKKPNKPKNKGNLQSNECPPPEPEGEETREEALERKLFKVQCDMLMLAERSYKLNEALNNELIELKKLNYGVVSRIQRLESLVRRLPPQVPYPFYDL